MQKIFENRMQQILKNEYPSFIQSLNESPFKAIRLNSTKKDIKDYINSFFALEPHPYVDEGYYFDYERLHLGKASFHQAGLYYIQEPSAMLVGEITNVQENDYVLDMCAAPGGKSTHIATKLNDTGLLVSNDIHPRRAKILSSNIERFGLSNVIVTNSDTKKLANRFINYFDKIILDAPCSGEGMFRKEEQAIATWSLAKIKECSLIQKELINQAYTMLKNNGIIVYSTCTYSREENEDVIKYATSTFPLKVIPIELKEGFTRDLDDMGAIRLYPHKFKGEGHFICLLQKNDNSLNNHTVKTVTPNLTKQQFTLLDTFYKENLLINTPTNLVASNNHIYQVKDYFPAMDTIRVLRNGLYLGESKKNRFEPSHSFALTLTKEKVRRYYSFAYDDENILKFLRGESLEGRHQHGYGIIYIDNYPLSFYKESNNQVKNLYPKGIRR